MWNPHSGIGFNNTHTIELGKVKGSVDLRFNGFNPLKARSNSAAITSAIAEDRKTITTQSFKFMQNRLGIIYRYNGQLHARYIKNIFKSTWFIKLMSVSANEIASVRWLRFRHCECPSDPFISQGLPRGVFRFCLPFEWEVNEPLVRWWIRFARCKPNLTRGLGSTLTSLKD